MKGFLFIFVSVLIALSLGCPAKTTTSDMPDPHAGIFTQKCAKCHDIARVEEAHKTKTKVEMIEILETMQQKPGSGITEEDLKLLIQQY